MAFRDEHGAAHEFFIRKPSRTPTRKVCHPPFLDLFCQQKHDNKQQQTRLSPSLLSLFPFVLCAPPFPITPPPRSHRGAAVAVPLTSPLPRDGQAPIHLDAFVGSQGCGRPFCHDTQAPIGGGMSIGVLRRVLVVFLWAWLLMECTKSVVRC